MNHTWHNEHRFDGRLVMVGFGSVGQGVLPLWLRHIQIRPDPFTRLSASDAGTDLARQHGALLWVARLTPDNIEPWAGAQRKRLGEFVNTGALDGFIGEGCQPAEVGCGSHERRFHDDEKRHTSGSQAAIYLRCPCAGTRMRS